MLEQNAMVLDLLADIAIVFFVCIYFLTYIWEGFLRIFAIKTKTKIDDVFLKLTVRVKNASKKAWEKLKVLKGG